MPATRIKCCMCGIQVHQNRLNLDYPLVELSTFVGAGRGRGFIWQKNVVAGACGSAYRDKLVDKLVKGAGKGVNIRIRSGKSGEEDD